jgi:peptidoglycan/LPS O-acetylase OafA/YrhL
VTRKAKVPKVPEVPSVPKVLGVPRVPDAGSTLGTRSTLGTSGTSGTPSPYRPQLDGLRALAVAAVAWSHWERPYQFGIPFGAGVHLFYVLSGFLITGILLELRGQVDRMAAVRAFYVRRALRIFPAFYVTLALAWLANVPPVRETIGWHLAYLSNVQIFATGEWPGPISHFWSLAVEEQFYLAWPWLIVFAPRRWLVPCVAAAIVSAPLVRLMLAMLGYRESLHGVLTPGSLDSLAVGALLAISPAFSRSTSRVMYALVPYAAVLLAQALGVELAPPLVAVKQTLQAFVFGWMIVRAAAGFEGVAGRVLSLAPVVYVGRISYGAYLVHGFAGAIALALFSRLGHAWPAPEPWRFIILCSVTVGAAALSWHLMERPLNRLKRFVPYTAAPRPTHSHALSAPSAPYFFGGGSM